MRKNELLYLRHMFLLITGENTRPTTSVTLVGHAKGLFLICSSLIFQRMYMYKKKARKIKRGSILVLS